MFYFLKKKRAKGDRVRLKQRSKHEFIKQNVNICEILEVGFPGLATCASQTTRGGQLGFKVPTLLRTDILHLQDKHHSVAQLLYKWLNSYSHHLYRSPENCISLHPGPTSQATVSALLILFSVFSLHRKYGTIDTFKIIKSERKRLVKELNHKMWRSYSPNQRTKGAADPFKRLNYWGRIGYPLQGQASGGWTSPRACLREIFKFTLGLFTVGTRQFEPDRNSLWTDVLCIAGCWAVSLGSAH